MPPLAGQQFPPLKVTTQPHLVAMQKQCRSRWVYSFYQGLLELIKHTCEDVIIKIDSCMN